MEKIQFVDITDESIDLYGRFPWNRQLIAQGIEVMKEFGAAKILFDIEFIEPVRHYGQHRLFLADHQ
jgi:CHASE2 domain-containing sensor protein